MATKWTCSDPECPPTEKRPIREKSIDDGTPIGICRECGRAYPMEDVRIAPLED